MTINCQKIIRGLNNGNRILLCVKKKGFKTILSTFIKKNINNWNFKGTRRRGCTHDAELFQTLVKGSFYPPSGISQGHCLLLSHFFSIF